MKKWLSLILSLALTMCLLSGCGKMESAGGEKSADAETVQADFEYTDDDMFTDWDYNTEYDEDSVQIELNGDSAEASSDSVEINGSTVTITEEATYVISGTLNDGMIVVNASDTAKVHLVLAGAEINSETSALIYVREADKVLVTLADGTENVLSNGGTFEQIDDNNIDAVIFSKQDLTLNGSGSLEVISPAGHGIVCKDDLAVTGGTYSIESASHGLDANDSVRITGDTDIAADTGKDGIHSENNDDDSLGFVYISGGRFSLEAEGDGISAGSYMQVSDGVFDILAGGGSENGSKSSSDTWGDFRGGGGREPGQAMVPQSSSQLSSQSSAQSDSEDSSTSMKGLKASAGMLITGGSFNIDSADDSVHSNVYIIVTGGDFQIASGDDAFHADESMTIDGCTIDISESYEGLEALELEILGGDITIVASDDGLNAAGGTDSSGTEGGRDGMFADVGEAGMGGGDPGVSSDGGHGGAAGGNMGGGMASSNGSIVISGGSLYINASGDGIDANGSVTISGGYIVVAGPNQGDTATLDYDTSAVITGGTFIGTGASGMAQTFSDSEQGVISVSVGSQSAGTNIVLTDADGNEIVSYSPELPFSVVIISDPDIVSGETYTVTVGSSSGEIEAS